MCTIYISQTGTYPQPPTTQLHPRHLYCSAQLSRNQAQAPFRLQGVTRDRWPAKNKYKIKTRLSGVLCVCACVCVCNTHTQTIRHHSGHEVALKLAAINEEGRQN